MKSKSILFAILGITLIALVSAQTISDDLHLNIQTTDSNGTVVTGTFDFVFNISNSDTCNVGNVVYSNSTTLTTDSRGIISYYLEDVTLDFDEQYWLCYYRDNELIDTSQIARTPYSFTARNVTLSGIEVDTNLNLTDFNITDVNTGFFGFLGSLADRITGLFVQDIDASGEIQASGNITTQGFFRGIYDWIIGSGSENYLDFNGTQLNFNEAFLNGTIDSRVSGGTGLNVNSSDYWNTGDRGSLRNISQIQGSWLNNDFSWINFTQGDTRYLLITDEPNLNVNSSNFWRTAEGDLNNVSEILGSWISNDLAWINFTQGDTRYLLITDESNLNVNSSEFLITNEGTINNIADILGSDITNDLNWINATFGNATYVLQSDSGGLNVNSSDFWDNLDTVADITGLTDSQIDNVLTINENGTITWAALTDYPVACTTSETITVIGDTIVCSAINITESQINDLQDYYLASNPSNFINTTTASNLNNLVLVMWNNITDAPTNLSFFTDDLGNRGYTHLSNFTNDGIFITWAHAVNGTLIPYSDEANLNVNSSNILVTSEGLIDDVSDILGSQITNDLNWINASQDGTLNVNSSDYWDGLDTFNSTQFENSGGILNISISWLRSLFIELTDSFGGDVSGTYDNLQINANAIGDNEINYTEVTLADFTNDAQYVTQTYGNVTYYLASNPDGYITWLHVVNGTLIPYSDEANLNVNSSEFLITNEGTINNLADILGSQITNDLNWINATFGNTTYYLASNPSRYINWSQATNGTLAVNSTITAYINSQDLAYNTSIANWVGGNFLSNSGDTATGNYNFDSGTLFIDSSNNRVGINTSTPQNTLNVEGSANVTQSLYVGNARLFTNQNGDFVFRING